jgi:hypothetical protein
LAGFGTLYFLCIRGQEASELDAMRDMWQEHFPPLNSPGDFAYWLLHTHTGDIIAYPVGGSPHQSSLSALCGLAALIALVRRRQGTFLVLCLAPLAVTFVAALFRRFPYGGHIRLNLYMAPLLCLLIGYGTVVLLAAVARRGWKPGWWLGTVLVLLAVAGGGAAARDLAGPYKSVCDQRARAFAEWFWYNAEQEGEAVCIKTDLGRDFSPDTYRQLCFSAEYLCNLQIYSPRHAAGEGVHWERISDQHPLRCVLYRCPNYVFDEAAFEAWLREMQQTYYLVGRARYPQIRLKNRGSLLNVTDSTVAGVDTLEIFAFVPKDGFAAQ